MQKFLKFLKMPFTSEQYPGYYCWGWIIPMMALTGFLIFVIGAYHPGLLEKGARDLEARFKADGTYIDTRAYA